MQSGKLVFILIILALAAGAIILGSEWYTSRPNFCGSCHIMVKYHKSWSDSKHKDIACVDCHYAPGEQHSVAAKFKGLSQLFSYFGSGDSLVRKEATISDESCTKVGCHVQDEKFGEKKISYLDSMTYDHKTHFDKTIEGQKLHCNTCHTHSTNVKHFEVAKETCYLCHFKNVDFNKGRGNCKLCHVLDDTPLQSQFKDDPGRTDIKPITHVSLETTGVSCVSCHLYIVEGDGAIKEEDCLDCHENGDVLEKADDKKLMHEKHVAGQEAKCFDCHSPIMHSNKENFLAANRADCQLCHENHHMGELALLKGAGIKDITGPPALMNKSQTSCAGCHVNDDHDKTGQPLLKATSKGCVDCHGMEYKQKFDTDKAQLSAALEEAKTLGSEALAAIEKGVGIASSEDIDEAREMYDKGKEYLSAIEMAHGVHNKKYSIKIIDEALGYFEDVIDEMEEVIDEMEEATIKNSAN